MLLFCMLLDLADFYCVLVSIHFCLGILIIVLPRLLVENELSGYRLIVPFSMMRFSVVVRMYAQKSVVWEEESYTIGLG